MLELAFTYLMTLGGALASLVNPFYGLLVYVSFAILRPEQLWEGSVPPGNYSRIVAIALLVGWAMRGLGNWRMHAAKPIVWALLGYWGWVILSACYAPNHNVAWLYVESRSKILLPVVVGFTIIDSANKLRQLAWVIALSQGYVAFLVNFQVYFQGSSRISQGYGYGTAGDNNYAAVGMLTIAGLAFFLGLCQTVRWRKYFAFALTLLMVHAVILTASRGGMLGLLVLGIATFALIARQPKYYLPFALAVAIAVRLVGPYYLARFQTAFVPYEQRDASAQSRIELSKNCWDAMCKHPVVGLGPGHFLQASVAQYGWTRPRAAHSTWMSTGAELGFPGLGFLIAIYACTLWKSYGLLRSRAAVDPWCLAVARMAIASLAGYLVSASFVSGEGMDQPFLIALLAAGALKLHSEQILLLASDSPNKPYDSLPLDLAPCS